jgi:molecular chaperone GrpE
MSDPTKPTDATDPTDLPADPTPHHLDEGWEPTESVPAEAAARAVEEAEERFLRLAAEYDNYRKRTTREKTEAFDRGAAALTGRLLDILDDIDRLAASDPATTSYDTYRGAFDLVVKKLQKELGGAGLEKIEPTGAAFDPTEHEAVTITPIEGDAVEQTVRATFQAGYRFKGAVLRPARVQVWSAGG